MADYEVDVLVNDKPIRQFHHKGATFIEGRKGSKFELKFTNNTWDRVEIVPSVDGLSVMNGKPCGVESDGYLVPARDSIIIPGWRLDDNNVAKFVFKGKEKSYSSKTGHGTTNVGAIGFMVFKEKKSSFTITPNPFILWNGTREVHHHHYHDSPSYGPYYTTCDNSPNHNYTGSNFVGATITSNVDNIVQNSSSIGSAANKSDNILFGSSQSEVYVMDVDNNDEMWNLGVGFGEESKHHVNIVPFTRMNENNPDEIFTIYYDSRKGLEQRGIQVTHSKKRSVSELPNPFPTYSGTGCTPPPGWKRK